jgi:hypothetical protein
MSPTHKFSDPLNANQILIASNYYHWLKNDSQSYNNQRKWIYKNLIKKYQKGIYDGEKAVKLFLYLCNNNKSRYFHDALYPNIRFKTACMLEEDFIHEVETNINYLLEY